MLVTVTPLFSMLLSSQNLNLSQINSRTTSTFDHSEHIFETESYDRTRTDRGPVSQAERAEGSQVRVLERFSSQL